MKIKILHIILLVSGIFSTNLSFGFFPEYENEIKEKGTRIIEQESNQSIATDDGKLKKAKDIYKKGKYKNKNDKIIISEYITIFDRKTLSEDEAGLENIIENEDKNFNIKSSIKKQSISLLAANKYYNRSTAVNYAVKWAKGRNQNYNFYAGMNDCTNFTSQVLQAGYMPYIVDGLLGKYDSVNWYYATTPSWTWGSSNDFYGHAKFTSNKYAIVTSYSDIEVGDIIQADWTRDGTNDHSMIVTEKTGNTPSQIKLTYHSTDTLNKKLSDIISAYPNAKLIGIKITY